MKKLTTMPLLLASALIAVPLTLTSSGPATAQDYWQYDTWEGEWEYHQPRRGIEHEFEDDEIDAEAEQYEYEPGEGYHEQEWYDPSDWFNWGRDFEYEANGYGDYYERDYYDGDYYDGDYSYDYGYYTDDWFDNDGAFRGWYGY